MLPRSGNIILTASVKGFSESEILFPSRGDLLFACLEFVVQRKFVLSLYASAFSIGGI